jgi:acetyl-CoA C-acetyltransferase
MKDAVIVSTARTPIGKAYRGGFNNLAGASLGAASVSEAIRRAGVEPGEIDDVIMGSALQQGATGSNVARQIALRSGLPTSVAGMTIDRQCSSGLMAIATGAKQIIADGMSVVVGGGLESISLVQNEHMNLHRMVDDELMAMQPNIHMPMLDTAEVVAKRYDISREAMDEYGLQSQVTPPSCPTVPAPASSWTANWPSRRAWSPWASTAVSPWPVAIPTRWASARCSRYPGCSRPTTSA